MFGIEYGSYCFKVSRCAVISYSNYYKKYGHYISAFIAFEYSIMVAHEENVYCELRFEMNLRLHRATCAVKFILKSSAKDQPNSFERSIRQYDA